ETRGGIQATPRGRLSCRWWPRHDLLHYINIVAFAPAGKGCAARAGSTDASGRPPGRSDPHAATPASGPPRPPRTPETKRLFCRKVLGAAYFLPYIAFADGFGPSINHEYGTTHTWRRKRKRQPRRLHRRRPRRSRPRRSRSRKP